MWSVTAAYRDFRAFACQGGIGRDAAARVRRSGPRARPPAYYHGAMFVGHLGVGLAAKWMAPRLNLGVLFLAAMLLDALLWIFVLLGLEQVHVPPNFEEVRYLTFTFPYSHGLIAGLSWSAAALVVTRACGSSARAGLAVAATVFSHFLLDALVHVVGLPVLGPGSYRLGLGLWRHTGLELAVECALGGLGWWMYLWSPRAAGGAARWGLGGLVALSALLTVLGGLATKPPPSGAAMAVTSLVAIGVLATLAFWLDRRGAAR